MGGGGGDCSAQEGGGLPLPSPPPKSPLNMNMIDMKKSPLLPMGMFFNIACSHAERQGGSVREVTVWD